MPENKKIYKILGKEGRITIPESLRERCGFSDNDIISFKEIDGGVVLRRECARAAPTVVINGTVELSGGAIL